MASWVRQLLDGWSQIEGLVSLLIGFYLGNVYWQRTQQKRAVAAIRNELALNARMAPQRRDILCQMKQHLLDRAILPAGGVAFSTKAYDALLHDASSKMGEVERDVLHVIYERLRETNQFMASFAESIRKDLSEAPDGEGVWRVYGAWIQEHVESLELTKSLIEEFLAGKAREVFPPNFRRGQVALARSLTLTERIHQANKPFYEIADRLVLFSKNLINAHALPPPTSPENALVAFFVVRAHTTFCAGLRLCREGYAINGVMLARNLVEELITLRYIVSIPGMADRYSDYEAAIKKRTLERVRKLSSPLFDDLKSGWNEGEAKILTDYEALKTKYGADFDSRQWAGTGKSLEALASVDAPTEELYNHYYGPCSQFIHGTVETSRHYMVVDDEGQATFFPGATDRLQPDGIKILIILFPLFWDEVSMLTGRPTHEELTEIASNELFEHFSRNPAKGT